MDKPIPFLILDAPRLRLRTFREDDLEPFLAYRSDPEVARFQGWPMPYTREMALEFVGWAISDSPDEPGDWRQLAVEVKASGAMIGDVAFAIRDSRRQQAELGVTFARAAHGHGYASEAMRCLLAYLFEQRGLHRVYAACDPQNQAVIRLLERLEFRREAHYIDNYWDRDHWTSEYVYALLAREWKRA